MADANVATLRAGYDALNRGDVSEVMALIDDDITWDPGELTPDRDAEASGPAGFEALIRSWIDAFDDFHIEPLEVTERGHFLIASVRQSGRGRWCTRGTTIRCKRRSRRAHPGGHSSSRRRLMIHRGSLAIAAGRECQRALRHGLDEKRR